MEMFPWFQCGCVCVCVAKQQSVTVSSQVGSGSHISESDQVSPRLMALQWSSQKESHVWGYSYWAHVFFGGSA